MTQFNLESFNPVTWDTQFLPQQFWLTMQDIENTPSLLSVKTSMYAGNFSLTADEYREVIRLSETKYAGIDTSGIFNWSVLPAVDMTWKDPWLYMTNEFFWFYDGTDWRAYIGNNGDFRFAGNTGDNYIQWNSFTNTVEVKWLITGSIIEWTTFTSVSEYWDTMHLSDWFIEFYNSDFSEESSIDRSRIRFVKRDLTSLTERRITLSTYWLQYDWSDWTNNYITTLIQTTTAWFLYIGWLWVDKIILRSDLWIFKTDSTWTDPLTEIWWWKYASWSWTRATSAWIGQVTIPVWFTAKLVKIRAVLASWEWAWSEWTYNWTWDGICIYWYNQNGWYYAWSSYDTTKVLYIRDWNGNTTRATLYVPPGSNNMYLDFWVMNIDVFYIWEAYG